MQRKRTKYETEERISDLKGFMRQDKSRRKQNKKDALLGFRLTSGKAFTARMCVGL